MHRHRFIPLAFLLLLALLPLLAACNSDTLPSAPAAGGTATVPSTAASGQPTAGGTASRNANLQIDPNASITGAPELAVGTVAPDFTLPGVDGKTYSLSEEKGKVTVLEFLATWCPHCQADAPMMNQLAAKYNAKDVQVFGINATGKDHTGSGLAAMSDLQWFKDTYSVTFPLLFDTELKSANDYGVAFYPSIYIVDRQGKVAFQPPDNQLPTIDMLSGVIDQALASK
jgi:peroxiredoxin